jgi:transcriptional regulator with XRE-family HTH domain
MYANPVKRLRKEHKITQQQLADAGDLQRLTVLRTEQGLYEEIPGAVMDGLARLVPSLDRGLVARDYSAFQRHMRALYGPLSVNRLRFDLVRAAIIKGHPLVELREKSGWTQIGLCKNLCVNAGLIHKWESGKQKEVPRQLLDALRDAGYSESDILWLERAGNKWLLHQSN